MNRSIGVLLAATGLAIATWTTGAGPVFAHEGTVTTVPSAVSAPAAGSRDTGGTDILPGVAEYVPASTVAIAGTTDKWSALQVMVAATGVLASGAAVVAVALRRRGFLAVAPSRLQVAGSVALLFTGVAHVALTPSHWGEGWHLGAFFVASGVVLMGQAAVLWLRPTITAYRSVIVSTAVMLVLYVAVREAALPFVDHRDPYLLADIPVKLAELFAANVALTALVAARTPPPVTPPAPAA